MRSQRPTRYRVPDWQTGIIDNKWRWVTPWGVTAALLLACICAMFSPWMIYKIRSNATYEFELKIANDAVLSMPETIAIRIDRDLKVHMGDMAFDISFPEIRQGDKSWVTDPIWRRQVRTAIQREFKKLPKVSAAVIQVDSSVQLEVIAIVWTSIQAISKSNLYLDVTND